MSEYNGWKNWDTWVCNLWLSNDEALYHWANEAARQSDPDLREILDAGLEYSETMRMDFDGINWSAVDWESIIDGFRDGYDRCECSDPYCREHTETECPAEGTIRVVRVDMLTLPNDPEYVESKSMLFCEACACDAEFTYLDDYLESLAKETE